MIDNELQELYSCSHWSNKPTLSPDEIINAHGEFTAKKSQRALINVPNYKLKMSDHNEEVIHFFYKDSNSFSYESLGNGRVNLHFNGRKIFIFLHGGYWQWGSVDWSSFMAENFTRKDIIVAAVGYRIAPEVSVEEIVNHVERAVSLIVAHSNDSLIYVGGHSAGAHLAATLLNARFNSSLNDVDNRRKLAGLILISGVFDLTPLLSTDINYNLRMSLDDAKRLSPMLITRDTPIPDKFRPYVRILLAYGQYESSAFKEQSFNYLSVLKGLNFTDSKCIEIANVDHFDINDGISDDNFELTKEIYKLMDI